MSTACLSVPLRVSCSSLLLTFSIMAQNQTPAPPQKLPLTAALVLTSEFCATVNKRGGEKFLVGKAACSQLGPVLKGSFTTLTQVDDFSKAGDAQVVLEPKFADVGATKPKAFHSRRELVVLMEWTARDRSGKTVWIETVEGSAKRRYSRNTKHIVEDSVQDMAQQTASKISSSPQLLKLSAQRAAVVAQQAPRVSSLASQAPAERTAAASAQQPSAGILQDGTPIKLRLLNELDSRTAKDGDEIPFDVVNDVVIGGITVLLRGSPATGVVTQSARSKTMGRAGKLSFIINDIQLRNRSKVPVRAFNRSSGENRTGEMIAIMTEAAPLAAAPFFLLMHGTNTTFPRGTEITAFVNGDLRLDLPSFDVAGAAEIHR